MHHLTSSTSPLTLAALVSATLTLLACPAPSTDEGETSETGETSTNDTLDDANDEVAGSCGDGVVDAGEDCDLGSDNAEDGVCTPECTLAACGDGYVYAGFEACDDGNQDNTDACLQGCEPASCGDGFVHAGVEDCDDGNEDDADGCTQSCTPGVCGDGVIQEGEQCDDGNDVTSDQCPACQLAFCGDGYMQAGVEACDDGNMLDDDACLPVTCVPATCGDGHIQTGVEECDDGNTFAKDECTGTCTIAFCGDGVKHDGVEECDDGNEVDDDFCTNQCISLLWWAEGPQVDVPEDMVGGWETCFTDTYADYSQGLTNTILGQDCTGTKLLIGCRPVGATNFTLLAMGEREDVIFDVGQGEGSTHEANGVAWYYSNEWSWGFALAGDIVQRWSCDVAEGNNQYRMCWHTGGDALNEGYRCGDQYPWNDYERVIMHAE